MNRAVLGLVATALFLIPQASIFASPVSAQSAAQDKGPPSAPEKIENVNADVVAARAATKDKRYADAETLMLKITSSRPELVVPWIELGLAQLGLKKYPEAETSFKTALGIDSKSRQIAHSDDFYQQADGPGVVAPTATRASRNTAGHTVVASQNRPPDVLGTAYASLGEIYVHEEKISEAQAAFDSAVQSNPTQAATYLGNETIFFFQAGIADAQLAAAEKAIAVDPKRAALYYFKGQALASKATLDPQTQKLVLPPGCAEAFAKYLELEPNGQFAADVKGILAPAAPVKPGKS